jgi:hypothetical protein
MDIFVASGWLWDNGECESYKINCGIFQTIELAVKGIDSICKDKIKNPQDIIKKNESYHNEDLKVLYKKEVYTKDYEYHFKINKEILITE